MAPRPSALRLAACAVALAPLASAHTATAPIAQKDGSLGCSCPGSTTDTNDCWNCVHCKCVINAGFAWQDDACEVDAETCVAVTADVKCAQLVDAHAVNSSSTQADLTCGCQSGYSLFPADCALASGACACESYDETCVRLAGEQTHSEGSTEVECVPSPGYYFAPAGCDVMAGDCTSVLTREESARRLNAAPAIVAMSNRQCCPGEVLYFELGNQLLNDRPH